MRKYGRTIFFWSLTLLFLITAPLVVFHARGYRFDFSRGVFVYSGTITFKSNPQAIDIKLNDELTKSKKLNMVNNSYNITGLLPGQYNIQISSDGFRSWSKKTDVHSGLSSEFWNVLLVRSDYPKTDLSLDGIDNFYTSPKNDYIAYTLSGANSAFGISIYNINSKKIDQSFNISNAVFAGKIRQENIEWSPDESYLSIPVEKFPRSSQSDPNNKNVSQESKPGDYSYYIYDISKGTQFDLASALGASDLMNARWDPQQKGYLFYLSGNALYRANIENTNDIRLIASEVSSYDLSGDGVYYVKLPNNLVYKNTLDGKSEPSQVTLSFPSSAEISRIVVYDDSRIALITSDKDIYVYNIGGHDTYFRKLGSGVSEAHFSNDGKKMLFWNDHEIYVYFLRDWEVQPVRAENDLQSITRYTEPVFDVQWFRDYEHIIFNTGRWTKVIELDPRDHRNCMDLVNSQLENPFVIYNSALGQLFFTDVKNDTTSLYSIKMPEPPSILGIQY